MSNVYGFMKSKIASGKLYSTYYYTKDLMTWKTWDAPVHDLTKGEEIP